MGEYDLREINEKKKDSGRSALTAQEMAVWTRQWGDNSLKENYDEVDDIVNLEDDTTISDKAADEELGIFGMIGRFFSRSVDINFNGTHLKGKVGYQVKGGPVSLFDGVVLDLTSAEMKGEKESGNRQKVVPKEGGTAAKLVVAPKNKGFMKEHKVDLFVIVAPRGGDVDVFLAEIDSPMSYNIGDGRELNAKGALIDQNKVFLKDPDINNREITEAEINQSGLIYEEPPVQKVTESDSESDGGVQIVPVPGGNVPGGNKPKETQQTVADAGTKKGQQESKPSSGVQGNVNVENLEFNLSWGALWGNDDDNKNTDELPVEGGLKEQIQAKLQEYYSKIGEGIEKASFAGGQIKKFFKTGNLDDNKFDTEDEDEDDSPFEVDASFPLVPGLEFKVGLSADYNYGFRVGIGMDAPKNDSKDNKDNKIKVSVTNGVPILIFPEVIDRIFKVNAYVFGKFEPKLSLMLAAGIGYIFQLEGGLTASGNLKGSAKGKGISENTIAFGEIELPVRIDKSGQPNFGNQDLNKMKLNVGAGAALEGSLGVAINANSKLFDFEKDLFEYELGNWNIAEITWNGELERDPSGSMFEKKGWKNHKGVFSVSLFGGLLQNEEIKEGKYGITFKSNSLKAISDTKDKAEGVLATMEKFDNYIETAKEGIVVGAPADSKDNAFIKKLRNMSNVIKLMIESGLIKINDIDNAINEFKSGKDYQNNVEKANKGIAKHQQRIGEMESWKGALTESEANEGAYDYYQSVYGASGAKSQKKNDDLMKAKNVVGSKEALLKYEKARNEEVTKKHSQRIEKLENIMEKLNINDSNSDKPNPEFLEEYKKLGATRLIKEAYIHSNVDEIIKYETARRDYYAQKHKARAAALKNWAAELGISNALDKPCAPFILYYENNLGGDRFFSRGVLMESHKSVHDVIEYERGKLDETDKKRMDNIDELRAALKENKDVGETRKAYLEKNKKAAIGYSDIFERASSRAKAATKESILKYEIERYYAYKNNTAQKKDIEFAEQSLAILKGKKYEVETYTEILNNCKKNGILKNWLNNFSDSEIMDMATLDDIQKISERLGGKEGEKGGKSEFNSKNLNIIKETKSLMVSWDGQNGANVIAEQLEKINDIFYGGKEGRQAWLTYNKSDKDSDAKKAIEGKAFEKSLTNGKRDFERWDTKYDEYLSNATVDGSKSSPDILEKIARDAIFGVASDKRNKAFVKEFKKADKFDLLLTPKRLEDCLEFALGSNIKKHKSRIQTLCEFMKLTDANKTVELPENMADCKLDASNSPKTDLEVNDFYHNDKELNAGSGFDDYYSKLKSSEKFNIREMLNYEEKVMMEKSQQSFIKKTIKELGIKVEGKINSADSKEIEDKINKIKKASPGGHYGRYRTLMDMVEQKIPDDEIFKKYREMGGGHGFEKDLFEHRHEAVTPQEIIDYEDSWSGVNGDKHDKRIKELTKLKEQNLSNPEIIEQYLEMTQNDNTSLVGRFVWDKIKDKIGVGKFAGYEGNVDTGSVLTPKVIMEYERSREDDLSQKHKKRIEELENTSEEEVLQKYMEMGGGSRFFRVNSDELKEKTTDNGTRTWGYTEVVDYEKSREKYYQEMLDEINKPITEIKNVRSQIEKQMEKLTEYNKMLENDSVENAFSSKNELEKFANITVGTDGQALGKEAMDDKGKVEKIENEKTKAQDAITKFTEKMGDDQYIDKLVAME